MTYYWKIRTTKPGYSLFTAVRKFSIGAMPFSFLTSIQLLSPSVGSTIDGTTPAFSWQPLQNATEYEFMLSSSMNMSSPLLDAKVENAGMQLSKELEAGKTYFWQVRATAPIESDWSPLGIFTVKDAVAATTDPPPPSTVTLTQNINLPKVTQTQQIFPPDAAPVVKEVVPGYFIITIFIMVLLIAVILWLALNGKRKSTVQVYTGEGAAHIRRTKEKNIKSATSREKPVTKAAVPPPAKIEIPAVAPGLSRPVKEKPAAPFQPETGRKEKESITQKPLDKSKEASAVIFAAKSLAWMSAAEKGTAESITDKEKEALGKKLADRVRELAKKEPLYIRHADDAAMLLQLWARYGSFKETNRYITDSLKNRPENAIRLIKCFLPQGISPDAADAAEHFNRDNYKALAEAADPDKVYEALTKASKYKHNASADPARVNTADSNITSQFMRLHLQNKNSR